MGLRILTGILKVKGDAHHKGKYNDGKATIQFNPFRLINNSDGTPSDATLQFANPHGETEKTCDPANNFSEPPNKVVSIREFYAHDQELNPSLYDRFSINDVAFDESQLEVKWKCNQSGSGIMEMTVLIIGETA